MRKLSEIVVKSAKRIFSDIILIALYSMIGSALLVPFVFFLPIGISLLVLPFLIVPICAGTLYATNQLLNDGRSKVSAMFAGAWKFALPSFAFALICSVFILIIVSTWWYYGSKPGMLYFALAVFQTYFAAMVLVSQLYTLPLVIQERIGIFAAMGRSVKLFLAHPGYTIGAFIQLLSVTLLLGVTVVGFAALFWGMYGVYANLVTANLIAKPKDEEDAGGGSTADEASNGFGTNDTFQTMTPLR